MAVSASRVTKLGMSGYMVRPNTSFAGKEQTEQAVPALPPGSLALIGVGR